ncbi:MAG TPA: hypothetical protein VKA65_09370 [Acidimicrobiales bacterium]|nr:hypothetical protein [Acidimicrobiales bacterium]
MATTRTIPPFPSPDVAPMPAPGRPAVGPRRPRSLHPGGGRVPGRRPAATVSATATGIGTAAVVEDPWLATQVVVASDRCGPAGMGNGGWVAGTVAAYLGPGPVEVTLVAPTPLDRPVDLRAADDRASLSDGDRLLVSARRVGTRPSAPPSVGWDPAVAARTRFAGHGDDHPVPGCFVCGTIRPDGLRLFTGPVAGAASGSRPLVATAYTPEPAHAGSDGRLVPAAVWALLDCPGFWVGHRPGMLALLGRLTAHVTGEVRVGRRYVVVAALVGGEGRRFVSRVAVHDVDAGVPVAAAVATWVTVAGPSADPVAGAA